METLNDNSKLIDLVINFNSRPGLLCYAGIVTKYEPFSRITIINEDFPTINLLILTDKFLIIENKIRIFNSEPKLVKFIFNYITHEMLEGNGTINPRNYF